MTVTASAPAAATTAAATTGATTGAASPEERPAGRSTPQRLRIGYTIASALIVALLAVVVTTFTVAQNAASTVTARAATASSASDLYFALSDLDAEAAREVLLGDGKAANGTDYGSSALSALSEYNARDQQADTDVQQLAAGTSAAAVSTLAHEITVYREIASQGVALDQDTFSPAGQSAPDAQGYYGVAATLMQSTILPEAAALRDSTSAQLADAASSAHQDAMIGAVGTGLLGVIAVLGLLVLHRRMSGWFRRSINLGVVASLLVVAGLTVTAASTLSSLSGDNSTAGSSFADYLAVTRAEAGAYNADAAVTRYLLAPGAIAGDPLPSGTGQATAGPNPVAQAVSAADAPIGALAPAGSAIADRWHTVSAIDLPKITGAAAGGNIDLALTVDTGTARGQDAFDFSYFDSAMQTLSDSRLAAFTSANSSSENSLADWGWLPWALAGLALLAALAGVRPSFAEFQ